MTIRSLVEALCAPGRGLPFLERIVSAECPVCGAGRSAKVDSWTGAWICKRCDRRGQLSDLYALTNPHASYALARVATDLCGILPRSLPLCWHAMGKVICDGRKQDRMFPEPNHYGRLAESLHRRMMASSSELQAMLLMGYPMEFLTSNYIGLWRRHTYGVVWLTRPIFKDGFPAGMVFSNPITGEEHTRLAGIKKSGTIRRQERKDGQAWMLS